MNSLKKSVLILFMALTLGLTSFVAQAAEQASPGDVISHIEKALIEIKNSDFSAAQVQLKSARFASDTLSSSDAAKRAHAALIQGQIQAKKGDINKATEELNQAIALFKSL
jgi:cellobiose-specific phosphotransferase system component IIA